MLDIIVAGGGPAGLATAIHAANAGLSVVVVEPRDYPIDKACGEGLMPSAVRMLTGELDISLAGIDSHEFAGISYRDERLAVSAPFRTGAGLGVRRTELSLALSNRLSQVNIPVIQGKVKVLSEARQSNGGAPGEYVEVEIHPTCERISARWLVAADGLHSSIRRQLGLARPPRRSTLRGRSNGPSPPEESEQREPHPARRFGLRRHYAIRPWSDFVEVYWSEYAEAYVTPVAENLVGVALLASKNAPFPVQLNAFPRLRELLADAEPRSEVRGAGPLHQRTSSRVHGRVLFVGDAAGYVDALTGEGISLAFASARELVRGLVADRPDGYEAAWRKLSRRYRVLTTGLLWARRQPLLSRRIVPAAVALPKIFARAVNLLAE